MDPIDVEDTQQVVEKKKRQYGQGNAGGCTKSSAKKNYPKKRKYHPTKEEKTKRKLIGDEKHLPAIKR